MSNPFDDEPTPWIFKVLALLTVFVAGAIVAQAAERSKTVHLDCTGGEPTIIRHDEDQPKDARDNRPPLLT